MFESNACEKSHTHLKTPTQDYSITQLSNRKRERDIQGYALFFKHLQR